MDKNLEINTKTNNLILRNLKVDDVTQDYADWLNDKDVNKYLSCLDKNHSIFSCREYVQSYQGRNDAVLVGIFDKSNKKHIGNVTLSAIDWDKKTIAVGISIGRKNYMGKGLAKETLIKIVDECFENYGMERIYAGIHVINTVCINLFMTCGFRIEKFFKVLSNSNVELQNGFIVSIKNNNGKNKE